MSLDLYTFCPDTLPKLAKSGNKTQKKKQTKAAKVEWDSTIMIITTMAVILLCDDARMNGLHIYYIFRVSVRCA